MDSWCLDVRTVLSCNSSIIAVDRHVCIKILLLMFYPHEQLDLDAVRVVAVYHVICIMFPKQFIDVFLRPLDIPLHPPLQYAITYSNLICSISNGLAAHDPASARDSLWLTERRYSHTTCQSARSLYITGTGLHPGGDYAGWNWDRSARSSSVGALD
jgi:hypothetical protein